MGSKSSPSAPVCSHSPDAVPINSSVHQVLFKCGYRQVFVGRPRRLPLPRGVHDMAWLAGRPGGILMIWPAIRSHLSATIIQCPVIFAAQSGLLWLSTSILVTWSWWWWQLILFLPTQSHLLNCVSINNSQLSKALNNWCDYLLYVNLLIYF